MTVSPPLQVRTRRPPPRKRSHRGRWISLAVVVGVVVAAAAGRLGVLGRQPCNRPLRARPRRPAALCRPARERRARAANGRVIPLTVLNGRITPRRRIAPGERITLSVVVRRPGWAGWALGAERRETLTVKAPAAHVANRWVTVARDGHAQVRFDTPIDRVSLARATVVGRTVTLPTRTGGGRNRSRGGGAAVGDPRRARPHHLVPAGRPSGRPGLAGPERARQPARPDPARPSRSRSRGCSGGRSRRSCRPCPDAGRPRTTTRSSSSRAATARPSTPTSPSVSRPRSPS